MDGLHAFVGHSFTADDQAVVATFLRYFDSLSRSNLNFRWTHAEAAEPKALARKVISLLSECNLFIGICSRKEHVIAPGAIRKIILPRGYLKADAREFRWKTSDWIIQEIGLAIGKELNLILLLEKGVESPGGLQGDIEYIPFDRMYPTQSFQKLFEMDQCDLTQKHRRNPATIELAVTMPLVPSHLEKELAATLGRPGGFLTTSVAFSRLAQAASRRLVVMTPFIDAGGFRWLRRVFEATPADCQKIVVLRNTDQYAVELGVQHADWLRTMQVSVRDYHLSHAPTAGRALPIETFHAKLIVADDTLAYVGSANLLHSSEELSLETGLLVDGGAAAQVARLVDAVLRVARSL